MNVGFSWSSEIGINWIKSSVVVLPAPLLKSLTQVNRIVLPVGGKHSYLARKRPKLG